MEIKCPVCGNEETVQKVSAIYSGGVQALGFETHSQSAKGMTISKLAMNLSPPPEPKKPSGLHWLLWILGLVLGVVFGGGVLAIVIMALSSGGEAGVFGGFLTGAGCGYPLGFLLTIVALVVLHSSLLKASRKRYEGELPIWQEKMEHWQSLYYCSRDDIVFDPSGVGSAKPEELAVLLSLEPQAG